MLAETNKLVCFVSISPTAFIPMSELGIDGAMAVVAETRIIEEM